MFVYRGIRLSQERLERWEQLAKQAGVNRNHLLGMLIDNAQIKPMEITVNLGQQKTVDEGAANGR